MIKAILFDFDGVLTIDGTGSQSICNYICKETGLSEEEFKREYYKYNEDLLYGETNHESIWNALCEGLKREINIKVLYESFIKTPIDSEMLAIVDKLKNHNYKIGMVTDNKKDRIDKIVKYYDWNKTFDVITVSAEVGSGKDYSEIFQKTIEDLNLANHECIFIDNQEKNLIVPKSMGMKVIYFDHKERNYERLIGELNDLFVEVE